MKFCTECGSEIPKNSKFCPECGTPVAHSGKEEPGTQRPASGTIQSAGNQYGRLNLEKLPEGHVIDNRYEVVRKLGQGSFGAVYLANDRKMEMQKVLKVIPEVISNDKKAMVLLRKEAAIMAKLNHKNIVRVYDFHDSGDINYIDMEYIEGQSLADLLLKASGNKLAEEEVKKYAIQITEGLAYAHNQRVIHKDIKPQNIMLTKDGIIKLMDFGIAETVHSSMSRLKNTGSSGTLVYMSPEQLIGENVGKEADIYSVGATLYELLSGTPPFHQGDISYQILNKKPDAIPGISDPANKIILKCLEKEKDERFKDCKALIHALKNPVQFAKKLKETTAESNKSQKDIHSKKELDEVKHPTNRKRKNSWTLWIILLVLIGAGGGYYFFSQHKQSKQPEEKQSINHRQVLQKTKPNSVLKKDTMAVKDQKEPVKQKKAIIAKKPAEEKTSEKKSSVPKKSITGKIQTAFVSVPSGANVIVDGQELGITPAILNLKKGMHEVKLSKDLYYDTTLIVNANNNNKLSINLRQKAKVFTLNTVPEGAKLYVDGNYKGITPKSLPLDFEKHEIKVVNQDLTCDTMVSVSAGTQSEFKFDLLGKTYFVSDKTEFPFWGGKAHLKWKTLKKDVIISVTPSLPDFPVHVKNDNYKITFPINRTAHSISYRVTLKMDNIENSPKHLKNLVIKVNPIKCRVLQGSKYNFNKPYSIISDKQNNIWVVNNFGFNVIMIPKGETFSSPVNLKLGRYTAFWSNAYMGNITPFSVAVDNENNIWIPKCGQNSVVKIPFGNTNNFIIIDKHKTFSQYPAPASIIVDKKDNVWVRSLLGKAGLRVIRPGANIEKPLKINGKKYDFTKGTCAMAVDIHNSVWIVNTKGNSVTIIPKGNPSALPVILNNKPYGFNSPMGIAIDHQNNVWITNGGNNSITMIPKGNFNVKPIILQGEKYGFNVPVAIAIDQQNNIWITNNKGNSVTMIPHADTSAGPVIFKGGQFEFQSPGAICVDHHNDIWVVNMTGNSVTLLKTGKEISN